MDYHFFHLTHLVEFLEMDQTDGASKKCVICIHWYLFVSKCFALKSRKHYHYCQSQSSWTTSFDKWPLSIFNTDDDGVFDDKSSSSIIHKKKTIKNEFSSSFTHWSSSRTILNMQKVVHHPSYACLMHKGNHYLCFVVIFCSLAFVVQEIIHTLGILQIFQ